MAEYKCEILSSGKVSDSSDHIERWAIEAVKGKATMKGAVENLVQTEFKDKGRVEPIPYEEWAAGIVVSKMKPQGYDYGAAYKRPYYKANKIDNGDGKTRYTVKVVTPYIKTEGDE